MDFQMELENRSKYASSVVMDFIPKTNDFDREIIEAMEYSLLAGGKRLRPILVEAFYRLFSGSESLCKPFMAAMEMLHTYSLVHDDLPALDNDDLRRGKPTTHIKYGEALGVLSGDGLLHLAYETCISAFDNTNNFENVLKALRIFGNKTGLMGMFGGQSADVVNTGRDISDELLYYIYKNKTGALIEGSMMIGAALAGAKDEELAIIEKIGFNVGMAFQIRDDILDVYGDEKVFGKPVLSDDRNNKKTYLSINGLDKSRKDVDDFTVNAINMLDDIGNNNEERAFIKELFMYLTSRNI